MAEPIQVKITDDVGVATISAGNTSKADPKKPINKSAKDNKTASILSTATSMVLMRSVNFATSNIGKWTGNSRLQQNINTAKQIVGYGTAFAINPIVGAITVAMDGITNIVNYAYEDKWNNIKAQQASNRAGGKGGYRR